MTNDFAKPLGSFWFAAVVLTGALVSEGPAEPPFVRPDLVIRHHGKKRGEQNYHAGDGRPTLTIRRRNHRPVTLTVAMNGDLVPALPRRDVRVAIIGPRQTRKAAFRYFFNDVNVTGQVNTGAFSGFVDPGFNVGNFKVQVVPGKRRVRRNGTIAKVTVRAFDPDAGRVVDSVRGRLKKRRRT